VLAIISDIHSNYEALSVVIDKLQRMEPKSIICLGDVVGYGPDPERCIDVVQQVCDVTLCGNHDFALIYGANDFSLSATQAINYHRARLMPRFDGTPEDNARLRRWQFLKSLHYRHRIDDILFVHGSPRNPRNEYLRQRDITWGLDSKMEENFKLVESLCFVGHTHRAGVFTGDLKYHTLQDLEYVFKPSEGQKAIINVGSVGQPRDGDPRACFVTLSDDRLVRFHRVAYDVERTIAKIEMDGALNLESAERLRQGR